MDDLQTLLTNMLGAEDSDDDEYVVRDEDESWSEYEVEDVEGEDESWSEYEVEDVEGEGEDEEDELNGEMLLIQEHLEALFQRLQEEAEAEYLQEFARVPAEKPQFDRVRCPKYHKLVYSRRKATGWACNGRDQFRDPRATKSRYGLTEDEEWKCLSGCTGYNQMDRVPVYHCSKCDFDLCFRCHERAKRGLERMKAVSATLNSTERVAWMQSKLMVVGEGRAGKTSTVRTLLGEPFVADLESTVGASLTYAKSNMNDSWNTVKEEGQAGHAITAAVKEFRQTNQDEAKVEKKLAPVEGEERRQHASGVSIESGFKAMRKKVRRALRGSSITAPLPRKFSSDKKEKKEKQPAAVMDIAEVAGKFKLDVFSDSLEEMERIKFTIWDYGGQAVFYSLHHLFLTRYGIYLVVFNVTSVLTDQQTAMDFLRFWIHSIRLHAKEAPIVLVGTHADALEHSKKATDIVEDALHTAFHDFDQIRRNSQEKLTFFALDNRTTEGIDKVRAEIEAASQKQSFLRYKVPIRWLSCLDALVGDDTGGKVSLTNVREIAAKLGVTGSKEVSEMLGLFHELGVIIHFTSTVALEKVVVTNPQWLIDELGKVIRDKTIHKLNVDEIEQAGLVADMNDLYSNGIASLDLLQFLWGREATNFFADLMLRTLLMSDWPYGPEQDKSFLIPSLLPERRVEHPGPRVRCKLRFNDNFLPDGYFQRLVCLSLGFSGRHYASEPPVIGKSFAKLSLSAEDDIVFLERFDSEIVLENTLPSCSSKDLSVVQSIMRKINDDVMGSGLQWEVLYFNEGTDGYIDEAKAKALGLEPWFTKAQGKTPSKPVKTYTDLDAFMNLVGSGDLL